LESENKTSKKSVKVTKVSIIGLTFSIAQTPVESTLPWKRDEDEEDESSFAVRQNEFPAWSSNKDYLAYNSPTNTFLGMRSQELINFTYTRVISEAMRHSTCAITSKTL
jgi:hypothetical protein